MPQRPVQAIDGLMSGEDAYSYYRSHPSCVFEGIVAFTSSIVLSHIMEVLEAFDIVGNIMENLAATSSH